MEPGVLELTRSHSGFHPPEVLRVPHGWIHQADEGERLKTSTVQCSHGSSDEGVSGEQADERAAPGATASAELEESSAERRGMPRTWISSSNIGA